MSRIYALLPAVSLLKNLQYQQRNNFGGYVAEWKMCALYTIYERLQWLQDIQLLSRQSLSYVPGVMGQTQSECIVFLISSHDEIDIRIFLYVPCAKAKLRTRIFYLVFILLYHVNVVGETTLLFGTSQQEAPHQHKGQIKILLRRVLALTYGTKFRCFFKFW